MDELQKLYEDMIRIPAYLKWEHAGKPIGRDVEFWLEAEKEHKQKELLYYQERIFKVANELQLDKI